MKTRRYINGQPAENDELTRLGEQQPPQAIASVAENTIREVRRRVERNVKKSEKTRKRGSAES